MRGTLPRAGLAVVVAALVLAAVLSVMAPPLADPAPAPGAESTPGSASPSPTVAGAASDRPAVTTDAGDRPTAAEGAPNGPTATAGAPQAPGGSSDVPAPDAETREGALPDVPAGFVARQGTELVLDGRPFTFTGMNIYNANSTGDCWFSMAGRQGLHRALRDIGPGQEVFRAWFFQSLATRRGKRDWRAFDRTLDLARARGQKVIVTLADHWGACEHHGRRDASFYASGYRRVRAPDTTRTYRSYVAEIVRRYRDDPAILMWQLVNEAEPARRSGSCASSRILRDFAADMSALVKRIDPHHLVSLGTIGGPQCGLRRSGYRIIHALPTIDVCEVHDYADPSAAMPHDRGYGVARRIAECQALGKPLFIGEVGFPPPGGSFARRATWLGRKFEAQFRAGVSGILMWGWRNGSRGGSARRDFDIGPGDPALRLLERF